MINDHFPERPWLDGIHGAETRE